MIIIDGTHGEGGGQILRTALGLSLVTEKPFSIQNIRGKRKKPGLLNQHLTAVNAAATIGNAELSGAKLGSAQVMFRPQAALAGDYHFAVGTAGSATLVLQAVLPALLRADGPSTLRLEGGTHNPWAPPFDFLQQSFLSVLGRMGSQVSIDLRRHGFYPAGGGEFSARIAPAPLTPLELRTRGEVKSITATALVARLPRHIAERELAVVQKQLDLPDRACRVEEVDQSHSPGNVVSIVVESEYVTEVFTGIGEKRVSAEQVARRVAQEAKTYLDSGVPVGEYLADQLLIPFALAGGGSFRTGPLSLHSRTNIDVIEMFLDVKFSVEEDADSTTTVSVVPR